MRPVYYLPEGFTNIHEEVVGPPEGHDYFFSTLCVCVKYTTEATEASNKVVKSICDT